MNIFIAAAGFGERLRPITLDIPKPMLPIRGRPIIDFVIEKSLALNPANICINTHYKKEAILRWTEGHYARDRIRIYSETEILGTGGALKNAEELLLSEDTFIVHNADVLSDIDLSLLVKAHDNSQYIATLCVIDFPEINTLQINSEGLLYDLSDVQRPDYLRRTFTGIAIYSSAFLAFLPEGSSSVVEGWWRAIEAGHRINTLDVTGTYWSDIGSFNGYAQTVFNRILREGEQVYIDHSFKDCSNIDYQGFVIIEKDCRVSSKITLKDSILMPGVSIDEPAALSNSIIGSNYRIMINPHLPSRLGSGGSNRSFFRVNYQGRKAVRMQCSPDDEDYNRHIAYTSFFISKGIPVPKIFDANPQEYCAVFEDLGDLSLYNWMRCNRPEFLVIQMYGQVLEAVANLHCILCENEYLSTPFRDFDCDYFLWESAYFLEHYVGGIKRIDSVDRKVKEDLNRLAAKASSYKKSIIHRDLQSQNIMLKNGKDVFFIDYQGARIGPPAYDIASLCYDPYVYIRDAMREHLSEVYITKRLQRGSFNAREFRESLSICLMQRLMQALGAYSFLAHKRNKIYFMKHIPTALRLLKQEVSKSALDLPYLSGFIEDLC